MAERIAKNRRCIQSRLVASTCPGPRTGGQCTSNHNTERRRWNFRAQSGKSGGTVRQSRTYDLTDQKEFFAEMTECYFGTNDFYPFVAGELKQAEPEIFMLLGNIWGPLPGNKRPTDDAERKPRT